jgi:uncharacterized membrane protein
MTTLQPSSGRPKFLAVSKHRIDALTDGVCAIVMTLLVLELRVPELSRQASVSELGHALVHDGPIFFSFLITFMFASLFWYFHHAVLNFIQELRPRLVVLNLAFLLFMAVLPFSVGMLGHFLKSPLAQTVYFANQFAVSLMLWLLWRSAIALKLVTDPHGAEAARIGIRITAIVVGSALAAATAWANVMLSFYAFLAVVLLSRLYARRKVARLEQANRAS